KDLQLPPDYNIDLVNPDLRQKYLKFFINHDITSGHIKSFFKNRIFEIDSIETIIFKYKCCNLTGNHAIFIDEIQDIWQKRNFGNIFSNMANTNIIVFLLKKLLPLKNSLSNFFDIIYS